MPKPLIDQQRLEIKRAYGRGYNAGRGPNWPAHRPPLPPDKMMASFISAARKLRDGIDTQLATLDADDEFTAILGPLVDALDEQFIAIADWLKRIDDDGT